MPRLADGAFFINLFERTSNHCQNLDLLTSHDTTESAKVKTSLNLPRQHRSTSRERCTGPI